MYDVVNNLIHQGLIPDDSRILSQHNNIVTESQQQQTVARIGKLSTIAARESPGDIRYSHVAARILGDDAAVLPPIHAMPVIADGFVISTFPKLHEVDWDIVDGDTLCEMLESFQEGYSRINGALELRTLNVAQYANARLKAVENSDETNQETLDRVSRALDALNILYPFSELHVDDPSVVHGDLHSKNVLTDETGSLKIIDLDSVATGPRLYDIASWSVRLLCGDAAPINKAVEHFRHHSEWNEEAYQALMSWKILSSMTHAIYYEDPEAAARQIDKLLNTGRSALHLEHIFGATHDGK